MWLWILLAVAFVSMVLVFGTIIAHYLDLEDPTVNVRGTITITSQDRSIPLDCTILECTRNLGRILRGKRYIDLQEDRDDMTCMEMEIPQLSKDDADYLNGWIFAAGNEWEIRKGAALLKVPSGISDFTTSYLLTNLYPTSIKLIPLEINERSGKADTFRAILTLSATWAIPTNSKPLQKTGLRPAHA